jgi:hypothetical protein
VWRDDGRTTVDALTASAAAHGIRGKDEELRGPVATIQRLTDSLRTTGRVDAAAAIGFGVTARE